MTSPAIKKSPDNQKSQNKSPVHSAESQERSSSTDAASTSAAGTTQPPETFSWLRIFKLADLMMKQGC